MHRFNCTLAILSSSKCHLNCQVQVSSEILISSVRVSGVHQGKNFSTVATCFLTIIPHPILLIFFSVLFDPVRAHYRIVSYGNLPYLTIQTLIDIEKKKKKDLSLGGNKMPYKIG